MELRLHPDAVAEARAARLWYAGRSARAAHAFVVQLDRALQAIVEAPSRWPVRAGVRRYVMRRFPFVIVYRESEALVEVIAIAHARRRPGYLRIR